MRLNPRDITPQMQTLPHSKQLNSRPLMHQLIDSRLVNIPIPLNRTSRRPLAGRYVTSSASYQISRLIQLLLSRPVVGISWLLRMGFRTLGDRNHCGLCPDVHRTFPVQTVEAASLDGYDVFGLEMVSTVSLKCKRVRLSPTGVEWMRRVPHLRQK